MKQHSGKSFSKMSKNRQNLKGALPNGAQKIIEPRGTQSDRSEPESVQNEEAPQISGFWKPKPNPLVVGPTGLTNSSWFTKVNQIHAFAGPKYHNKENRHSNKGYSDEGMDLGDDVLSGDGKNKAYNSHTEKRIARFMKNLTKKLRSYIKDNNGTSQDTSETKRRFESYIRSMNEEELEQFLKENEQEYENQSEPSQKSEVIGNAQDDHNDAKSEASLSEIPQEEIILMTNLAKSTSTEATSARTKSKYGKCHFAAFTSHLALF